MHAAGFAVAALVGAAMAPVAITGTVQVHGPSLHPRAILYHGDARTELVGELASELRRLQSATIEAVGDVREGGALEVKDYRIVDLGGGVRPLVGLLARGPSGSMQLVDGEGEPISLSVSAAMVARLADKVGAKVWVHGKTLVSGELQVQRYGILRDPPARRLPTPPVH